MPTPDIPRFRALVAQYQRQQPQVGSQVLEFWDPDPQSSLGGRLRQTLPYSRIDAESMSTVGSVELVEPGEPMVDGGVPRFSTVSVARELVVWPVEHPNAQTLAFGAAVDELEATERALDAVCPDGERIPEELASQLRARTDSFLATYERWAEVYRTGVEAPAPLVTSPSGEIRPAVARSHSAPPADRLWDGQVGGVR